MWTALLYIEYGFFCFSPLRSGFRCWVRECPCLSQQFSHCEVPNRKIFRAQGATATPAYPAQRSCMTSASPQLWEPTSPLSANVSRLHLRITWTGRTKRLYGSCERYWIRISAEVQSSLTEVSLVFRGPLCKWKVRIQDTASFHITRHYNLSVVK